MPEGSCVDHGVYAVDMSIVHGIEFGRRLRTFVIKKEDYRSCTNTWANIFLASVLSEKQETFLRST
jgi:hypothetical protein